MNWLYTRIEKLRPYVLSILRIVVALLFLQHGLSKVFGFPVPGPSLSGLFILAAFLETVGSLL
ncbi:MAG TPA: DoxX family protein, partial [Roseiarcus sp.]|nr:DoxX family protein [Roseiarcus sp.]